MSIKNFLPRILFLSRPHPLNPYLQTIKGLMCAVLSSLSLGTVYLCKTATLDEINTFVITVLNCVCIPLSVSGRGVFTVAPHTGKEPRPREMLIVLYLKKRIHSFENWLIIISEYSLSFLNPNILSLSHNALSSLPGNQINTSYISCLRFKKKCLMINDNFLHCHLKEMSLSYDLTMCTSLKLSNCQILYWALSGHRGCELSAPNKTSVSISKLIWGSGKAGSTGNLSSPF